MQVHTCQGIEFLALVPKGAQIVMEIPVALFVPSKFAPELFQVI